MILYIKIENNKSRHASRNGYSFVFGEYVKIIHTYLKLNSKNVQIY